MGDLTIKEFAEGILPNRLLRSGSAGAAELEKLEKYLKENKYPFISDCLPYFDEDGDLITGQFNQIIVFERVAQYTHGQKLDRFTVAGARVSWDAICYFGSCGYSEGLLEGMGSITRNGRPVEGWLSADDIIARLEENKTADDHEFVNRHL